MGLLVYLLVSFLAQIFIRVSFCFLVRCIISSFLRLMRYSRQASLFITPATRTTMLKMTAAITSETMTTSSFTRSAVWALTLLKRASMDSNRYIMEKTISLTLRRDFSFEFLVRTIERRCRMDRTRKRADRIVAVWMLATMAKTKGKNRERTGSWTAEMWLLFDIEYCVCEEGVKSQYLTVSSGLLGSTSTASPTMTSVCQSLNSLRIPFRFSFEASSSNSKIFTSLPLSLISSSFVMKEIAGTTFFPSPEDSRIRAKQTAPSAERQIRKRRANIQLQEDSYELQGFQKKVEKQERRKSQLKAKAKPTLQQCQGFYSSDGSRFVKQAESKKHRTIMNAWIMLVPKKFEEQPKYERLLAGRDEPKAQKKGCSPRMASQLRSETPYIPRAVRMQRMVRELKASIMSNITFRRIIKNTTATTSSNTCKAAITPTKYIVYTFVFSSDTQIAGGLVTMGTVTVSQREMLRARVELVASSNRETGDLIWIIRQLLAAVWQQTIVNWQVLQQLSNATTEQLYSVMDEKESTKLAVSKRRPIERAIVRVMVWERILVDIDTTVTFGWASRVQVLPGHDQFGSIVQTEEHPSPFRLLPSSQRSVIMIRSPQKSWHFPVALLQVYPVTAEQVRHELLLRIYPSRQDVGPVERQVRLLEKVAVQLRHPATLCTYCVGRHESF